MIYDFPLSLSLSLSLLHTHTIALSLSLSLSLLLVVVVVVVVVDVVADLPFATIFYLVWKTRQFDDILLRHCNAVYNQNLIDRWIKGCILPFPTKGDLGLAQNYRGITRTSIVAKIYNTPLRNRIEPKIDSILWKNQNGFWKNRSMASQILTIRRLLEGVREKNPTGDNTICWLYQGLWFHSQKENGTNSTSIWHTKRVRRSNNDSL